MRRRLNPSPASPIPSSAKAAYARLVSAPSLITGTAALIVQRGIRGLSDTQAIQVSQWMARAVLRETLRETLRELGGK